MKQLWGSVAIAATQSTDGMAFCRHLQAVSPDFSGYQWILAEVTAQQVFVIVEFRKFPKILTEWRSIPAAPILQVC